MALGFALNRADHSERMIAPFLNGGAAGVPARRVVICDRYYMSSLVYQSSGGLSIDDVMDLNKSAPPPDLTLFLDASPDTSYERISARQLKLGFTDRELFEERLGETREKYLTVIDYLRKRGEHPGSSTPRHAADAQRHDRRSAARPRLAAARTGQSSGFEIAAALAFV
ncbi:MAG: hypothetical protein LC121_05090 [Anaerolineae bacterium]|nr:hypothetical protein [Anaerolineae bacterium]